MKTVRISELRYITSVDYGFRTFDLYMDPRTNVFYKHIEGEGFSLLYKCYWGAETVPHENHVGIHLPQDYRDNHVRN